MKTKERILDAALKLFNEQGTGAVSTNHIAEAAGISPGNLYYHFHNKEEIIRALFERLFVATDVAFAVPAGHAPTLTDVIALVRTNFEIIWQYSFVYRELLALLRQDPALHGRFLEVRQRGYDGFREILIWFSQSGVMLPPEDETTLTRLADLCWLISEFWLTTVEVGGRAVDEGEMQRGIDLMMQVLRPYLPR
jgi:AcrR family transcriptional regulator